MKLLQGKGGAGIAAALVATLLLVVYMLNLQNLPQIQRLPESFGTNLGFESGDMQGWTTPLDNVQVVSDTAHSGKYSAFVDLSTKHSTELYQNWKVNPACEIYLEAYVHFTYTQNWSAQPFSAGIKLRELDLVAIFASADICPNSSSPPDMPSVRLDSIFTSVWIDNVYTR